MNEENNSKDQRVIPLTREEYLDLERAMQWPEDLAAYDRSNKPTNFADVLGNLTTI
jgi:hypothetical protein